MRQFLALGCFVLIISFAVMETIAQPPEGGGGGRGRFRQGGGPGGAGRSRPPAAPIGTPEPQRPSAANTTLGVGTVPALWELTPSRLSDTDYMSLEGHNSIAPPVPAKVIRYAMHLLERYDVNGDGVLQKEEWMKMPGTPQAIDIDGDGNIELDELVRYLAVYGEKRTIHRPNPIETFYQPRVVSSQFQLFKPLTAPPPVAPPTPEEVLTTTEDMTEERAATDGEFFEDTTYEDIVAGTLPPTEKKYYTTPEALRGVPRWFLALDRNGDGQVSLAEFAPNMSPASLALFGRLDKNGDGFITPDEVRKEEPPKKEEPIPEPQVPAEPPTEPTLPGPMTPAEPSTTPSESSEPTPDTPSNEP